LLSPLSDRTAAHPRALSRRNGAARAGSTATHPRRSGRGSARSTGPRRDPRPNTATRPATPAAAAQPRQPPGAGAGVTYGPGYSIARRLPPPWPERQAPRPKASLVQPEGAPYTGPNTPPVKAATSVSDPFRNIRLHWHRTVGTSEIVLDGIRLRSGTDQPTAIRNGLYKGNYELAERQLLKST
jgi:hypothetical protein